MFIKAYGIGAHKSHLNEHPKHIFRMTDKHVVTISH